MTIYPQIPTYDEAGLEYDDSENYYNQREEETEGPQVARVITEQQLGYSLTKTGIKLFSNVIAYNEDVAYDSNQYYGAREEETEKPAGGKIYTES